MSKEKKFTTEQGRKTHWTLIVYPESAPADWREIIEEEHIQWVESPLHDLDLDADGKLKKPHYHIMVMFPSLKSYTQIKQLITDKINCTIPKGVHSPKQMLRYFAHLDNKDKVQYNQENIVGYGGFDVEEALSNRNISTNDRYIFIAEMMDFILENEIVEFQDIADYSRNQRVQDWFPILCDSNGSMLITNYIKSMRHRSVRTFDYTTGEVLEQKSSAKVNPPGTITNITK